MSETIPAASGCLFRALNQEQLWDMKQIAKGLSHMSAMEGAAIKALN
jgi:hypothetical protein